MFLKNWKKGGKYSSKICNNGEREREKDSGMKCLQIYMFDSDFYLQKVWILHLDKRPSKKCKRRFSKFSNFRTRNILPGKNFRIF